MRRVLSALVLIAILVAAMFWLPWWATVAVTAIAAALAGHELAGLARHAGATASPWFTAVTAAAVATAFALDDHALPPILFAAVIVLSAATLAGSTPVPAALMSAGVLALAPLYIGLPLGALGWVHVTRGPWALAWLIIVIAASDSAQYYSGRLFGRRKLAPVVSPGKTVEGAIGGVIVAAIAGGLLAPTLLPGTSAVAGVMVAIVLALCGMVGDLFESLLKRSAGVKDSSTLIPGHGGVLDRIDAYLVAAPAYYLYLSHVPLFR